MNKNWIVIRNKYKLVKRLVKRAEENEILQVKKKYDLMHKIIVEIDDLINDSIDRRDEQ